MITGGASGFGLAAAKRFAATEMKLCFANLAQDGEVRTARRGRRYQAN